MSLRRVTGGTVELATKARPDLMRRIWKISLIGILAFAGLFAASPAFADSVGEGLREPNLGERKE